MITESRNVIVCRIHQIDDQFSVLVQGTGRDPDQFPDLSEMFKDLVAADQQILSGINRQIFIPDQNVSVISV